MVPGRSTAFLLYVVLIVVSCYLAPSLTVIFFEVDGPLILPVFLWISEILEM